MRKPALHRSFAHAFRGLFRMIRHERNFQIELAALLVNVFLIILLPVTAMETMLILLVSCAVLSLEILNTCLEKLCDFIHPEFDVRIGLIKDIAAGSVLLMALASIVTGALIYLPYLMEWM